MNPRQKWLMALAMGVLFVIIIFYVGKQKYDKYNIDVSGDTIYPMTLIDGDLYKWDSVILGSRKYDFTHIGRLNHIEGTTLSNDCDMISVFEIKGQFYRAAEDPENVYAYVNTEWLSQEWVLFVPETDPEVIARVVVKNEESAESTTNN